MVLLAFPLLISIYSPALFTLYPASDLLFSVDAWLEDHQGCVITNLGDAQVQRGQTQECHPSLQFDSFGVFWRYQRDLSLYYAYCYHTANLYDQVSDLACIHKRFLCLFHSYMFHLKTDNRFFLFVQTFFL